MLSCMCYQQKLKLTPIKISQRFKSKTFKDTRQAGGCINIIAAVSVLHYLHPLSLCFKNKPRTIY